MYKIVIPRNAQKDLKKIDKLYKERILVALNVLSKDPFTGKKLKGDYKMQYSYRVWLYRIIYEIRKRELVVIVIRVGHRQGVY
ncbi:type II toxin-antitoxin system RelE/ParE family toxin [Candidatus Parcubacteria bacterium]|nr:type II toxin-antitoxin system RelE/ParE family toxin [Candidatus Parcubacteria bacterium]